MATVWLDLWRNIVVVRRHFSPTGTSRARPDPPGAGQACSADNAYRQRCSWLDRAADHPVVDIVHRGPVRRIISSAFVGSATLASRPVPAADGARLIAALARVVHRLHTEGLVHGALQADHVILAGNRFWLCSPAEHRQADLRPATDVDAIGRLYQVMATDWEANGWQGLNATGRRRWNELVAATKEPSMSAARSAARADRL